MGQEEAVFYLEQDIGRKGIGIVVLMSLIRGGSSGPGTTSVGRLRVEKLVGTSWGTDPILV
jgi:hypothetical protein